MARIGYDNFFNNRRPKYLMSKKPLLYESEMFVQLPEQEDAAAFVGANC